MTISLRPYQEEAIVSFFNAVPEYRRQLMIMPTGSGKTITFGDLARRYYEQQSASNKPIVILAHRTELLDQAEAKLNMVWPGVVTGRVQGRRNEQLAQVILASTQTLVAGRKIPEPSLVILDECHHGGAYGVYSVLESLGVFRDDGPPLLGVTATPTRTDGNPLGNIFEHITYEKTILQMIVSGYLTDVRGIQAQIPNLDFKHIRSSGGDYNTQDLASTLNHEIALNAVVESFVQYCRDRKTVVFAVNIAHATALAERFRLAGYSAAAVSGSMHETERKRVLSDFADDKLQVLVNCSLLVEGWDQPSVSCVVISRPTKSTALYTQMVGRALRLHPSKKDALVLDLTGSTEDKNLQTFAKLVSAETPKRKTQEGRKSGKKGFSQSHENKESLTEIQAGESIAEWLDRLKHLEQLEKNFVQSINLFANRTRYRWEKIGEHFAISYGDANWAFLFQEELKFWPVLDIGNERYLPLHDDALPLEYAQGIAEGFLELLESKVIEKEADWRTARISQRLAYLLDRYRIAYDMNWTRGMASDELSDHSPCVNAGASQDTHGATAYVTS